MQKLQDRPLGECSVCGEIRKVRQDGTMYAHGPRTGPPFEKNRLNGNSRWKSSHECNGNWLPPVRIINGTTGKKNGS